jgi:hypothetical protein
MPALPQIWRRIRLVPALGEWRHYVTSDVFSASLVLLQSSAIKSGEMP